MSKTIILHSNLSGLSGYDVNSYHTTLSYHTISYYTPEQVRKNRIQELKTELINDPELLNDVITELRKDKIKKIKNKGGF